MQQVPPKTVSSITEFVWEERLDVGCNSIVVACAVRICKCYERLSWRPTEPTVLFISVCIKPSSLPYFPVIHFKRYCSSVNIVTKLGSDDHVSALGCGANSAS
jgi:hypothetical protein